MAKLENISIEQLVVEEGIRQSMDADSLNELASSIKLHGVLQPLIVELVEDGKYSVKIGKRRLAASKLAGLDTVPVIILDAPMSPEDSLAKRLVENLHREDIDPIDEAEAYLNLKEMGVRVSEIARQVGKERTYVSHAMRLLKLHPKVREAMRHRTIPRDQALTLLRLETEQQPMMLEDIIENGLTMLETRDKVRALLGKELKWRLVPIRLGPAIYNRLVQIAPEGDVSSLLKQAIENLLQERAF